MSISTSVPLLHPRAFFREVGLGWLFDNAHGVVLQQGSAAYEHQVEELRTRLRDRGLSRDDAAAWADWAVWLARETFVLELLGLVPARA